MPSPYDRIPQTWRLGKGREYIATDAPKGSGQYRSLQKGRFICMVINVYGALLFLAQICAYQKCFMSHLYRIL